MKAFFKRLIGNERGLTLPEYGIGLALAIGVGTVALGGLSNEITGAMVGAGLEMPCDATTGANCAVAEE